MPHGSRYANPARMQLQSPARNAVLRPLRSASFPTNGRLHNATAEKVPMTNPTLRSDAPRSRRTCGARPGKTAPNPRNPIKVAPMRHQKRPPSDVLDPIVYRCTKSGDFEETLDWKPYSLVTLE